MKKRTDVTRIVRRAQINLNADAKTVFPLLCPVKEEDWIDGWEDVCTIVYTDSGIAEEACVFETGIPGGDLELWICSKYDAENYTIEFVKHVMGKAIIKWRMAAGDLPDGKSKIDCVYNATGMGTAGMAYVKLLEETGLDELFARLEEEINYYVTTGKKLIRNVQGKE